MDKIERIKMVKAMEFIARSINSEDVLEYWLVNGVADGDIKYGDLTASESDEDDLYCYLDNEDFADLMDAFLWVMAKAKRNGGIYFDDVVSKPL